MLFASYEFLGFLFCVFLLYYVFPKQHQWKLLLLASYVFYFCADPIYLVYIFVTTVTTFLAGIGINKIREQQKIYLKENKEHISKEEKKIYTGKMKSKRWKVLLLCLIFNLGILAVVKYTNFVISNINSVLEWIGNTEPLSFWNIVLPMGISFYTFQAMGYIIDVYRGTVEAEKNFFRFALFVSFFPQLVQGPISRFGDLSKTLFEGHRFDKKVVCYGLQRIMWGFFKKLVIADRILAGVNTIIKEPEMYSGAYVFVGMMFYAVELYADFTGGIDITIGVAEVMGITVTENFRRPFFSKSIKEYWNRWHITMGSWFTDYIFYPISVCQPMLKVSKFCRKRMGEFIGKRVPIYLSSFVVWLATGIWHGASWNFIVWGLANWLVIMVSQECEPLYKKFHERFPDINKDAYKYFQVARTILLMSCLRTFDCYRDVPLTFKMFGTMFTEFNWNIIWNGALLNIGLSVVDYLILLFGILLMLSVSLVQRAGKVRDRIAKMSYVKQFCIWYGLFLIILLMGAYGEGYDATQFIYNQF